MYVEGVVVGGRGIWSFVGCGSYGLEFVGGCGGEVGVSSVEVGDIGV